MAHGTYDDYYYIDRKPSDNDLQQYYPQGASLQNHKSRELSKDECIPTKDVSGDNSHRNREFTEDSFRPDKNNPSHSPSYFIYSFENDSTFIPRHGPPNTARGRKRSRNNMSASSDQCAMGTKKKPKLVKQKLQQLSYDEMLRSSAPHIEASNNRFYCRLCDTNPMKPERLRRHIDNSNHKKQLLKIIKTNGSSSHQSYCDICLVIYNSARDLDSHIRGKKHQKEVQRQMKTPRPITTGEPLDYDRLLSLMQSVGEEAAGEDSGQLVMSSTPQPDMMIEGGGGVYPPGVSSEMLSYDEMLRSSAPYIEASNNHFYCRLCHTSPMKPECLRRHLDTSKHKNILKITNGSSSNQNYCDICLVSCYSAIHLDSHIRGKKHQRKVQRQMKTPRPITTGKPLDYDRLLSLMQSVGEEAAGDGPGQLVMSSTPQPDMMIEGGGGVYPPGVSSKMVDFSQMEGPITGGSVSPGVRDKGGTGSESTSPKGKNCSNPEQRLPKARKRGRRTGTSGQPWVEAYSYRWSCSIPTMSTPVMPSPPSKPHLLLVPPLSSIPPPSDGKHPNDRPLSKLPLVPPPRPPSQPETTLKQFVQALDSDGEMTSGCLQNVMNSLVQNEEDADAALKLSMALTQALVAYRQKT